MNELLTDMKKYTDECKEQIQVLDFEQNKACGLDIHKLFFIATILSRSGEKQQQNFKRNDEGILALKNWVISEKCDVVACESTSEFWVPIYDSLIKHLPVIVGNARDMKAFTHKTGYEHLDERIGKTKEDKEHLLKVLVLPEIPLHNNAAELAARAKVRKKDVSLQTITEEGTKANDTFMTIVQAAKKLGVNAYQYICDRVSDTFEMTSLAQLIREKSALSGKL